MKTRYSKEKILESLRFWRDELKKLDESKSPLLDDFISKFGRKMVLSITPYEKVQVTIDFLKDIYQILNAWMFKSKLNGISFVIESEDEYKNSKADHFAVYSFTHHEVDGEYKLLTKRAIDSFGKIHYPPRIKFPWFIFEAKVPFMFIANILAHEMIHQYDVELGDELKRKKKDDDHKKKHDPHGEVFKRFMNDANDLYGMNIEIVVDGHDLDQEFFNAIISARNKIDEKEAESIFGGKVVTNDENQLVVDYGNGFMMTNMY